MLLIVIVLGVLRWMILHPWSGIPLVILARGLFVLARPYRDCRWCQDRKERPRPWNRRRCWFCRNTRLTRRLGAYHVHKVKLSLIQAWDEWRSQ